MQPYIFLQFTFLNWIQGQCMVCLYTLRIKLLPEAVRPKASVWLDGFTKHFLPKNPFPKCFVIPF